MVATPNALVLYDHYNDNLITTQKSHLNAMAYENGKILEQFILISVPCLLFILLVNQYCLVNIQVFLLKLIN
jgi:hypothetical protein